MKWITRARPKTDRIACPWLIAKFIDPDAEILYVPAGQVLTEAQRQDAVSFDAPGARYDHRDSKCTFEVLIEDHHLDGDPALVRLAKIVHAADPGTRGQLAAWMRARGKERRERIWFRDADAAEAVDAILFVGLLPGWYPPNYDCGACGYATCAEFLHHTKTLRGQSAELEFTGPVCNLRDIDLGIAVGSAAKTAAIHSIDCRCQTRAATAARKLGLIQAEHAVALSLSMTHKAVGFDRPMPEADFDNLDLPPTGTRPTGVPGATRHGGARNRQAP